MPYCYRWSSVVCQSVSLSHREPYKWPNWSWCCLDFWTLVCPRNHLLDAGPYSHTERGNYEGEKLLAQDLPGRVWRSIYSKWLSRGQNGSSTVRMSIGVYLMGVHIGATCRIRLNRPCAAAMRPYVQLVWRLVAVALQSSWPGKSKSSVARQTNANAGIQVPEFVPPQPLTPEEVKLISDQCDQRFIKLHVSRILDDQVNKCVRIHFLFHRFSFLALLQILRDSPKENLWGTSFCHLWLFLSQSIFVFPMPGATLSGVQLWLVLCDSSMLQLWWLGDRKDIWSIKIRVLLMPSLPSSGQHLRSDDCMEGRLSEPFCAVMHHSCAKLCASTYEQFLLWFRLCFSFLCVFLV